MDESLRRTTETQRAQRGPWVPFFSVLSVSLWCVLNSRSQILLLRVALDSEFNQPINQCGIREP